MERPPPALSFRGVSFIIQGAGPPPALSSNNKRQPSHRQGRGRPCSLFSMHSEPQFFSPFAEIEVTANNLPHWQQPGATYFITFRLADSIPTGRLEEWRLERKAWLTRNPEPWSQDVEIEYHRLFSQQIDTWLDAGHGDCPLRDPIFRKPLSDSLRHSDGERYQLHSWVTMPNHVHVLVTLSKDDRLESEVGAWKSVSAKTGSIAFWIAPERCGRRTTLTGSCVIGNISRIVFATSGAIQRKRGCRRVSSICLRAILPWGLRLPGEGREIKEHFPRNKNKEQGRRAAVALGPVGDDAQYDRAEGGPAP